MVYGNVRKARGHHLFRRSPRQTAQGGDKHAPGQREVGGKFPILVFGHEALLQGKGDGGVGPVGIQLALVKIQGLGAPVHPGVLGGEVELARLGGDAPPPEQFLHRDQFKALGLQLGQQPVQPLGGGGHRLMDQDDVPVPGLGGDVADQMVGVPVLPVAGVHRPADHRGPRQGQHPLVPAAKGRAQVKARIPRPFQPGDLGEGLGQAVDLLPDQSVGTLDQIGVVVGMVGNLMPFRHHSLHLGRINPNIIPIHKEGSFGPVGLQGVQNGSGIAPGTIVKGQCGQFLARTVIGRGSKGPRHQANPQHQGEQPGSEPFPPGFHGQVPLFPWSGTDLGDTLLRPRYRILPQMSTAGLCSPLVSAARRRPTAP